MDRRALGGFMDMSLGVESWRGVLEWIHRQESWS